MSDQGIKKVDFGAQCKAIRFMYDQFGLPGGREAVEKLCNSYNPHWNETTQPSDAYIKGDKYFVQQYLTVGGNAYPADLKEFWECGEERKSPVYSGFYDTRGHLGRWCVGAPLKKMFSEKEDPFIDGVIAMHNCLTDRASEKICEKDDNVLQKLLTALNEEFKLYSAETGGEKSFDGYDIVEWQVKQEPDTPRRLEKMIELAKMKLSKAMELYYEERTAKLAKEADVLLEKIADAEPWYTSKYSKKAKQVFDDINIKMANLKGSGVEFFEGKYLLALKKIHEGKSIYRDASYRPPVKHKEREFGCFPPDTYLLKEDGGLITFKELDKLFDEGKELPSIASYDEISSGDTHFLVEEHVPPGFQTHMLF